MRPERQREELHDEMAHAIAGKTISQATFSAITGKNEFAGYEWEELYLEFADGTFLRIESGSDGVASGFDLYHGEIDG
jgi:hypothetical protein